VHRRWDELARYELEAQAREVRRGIGCQQVERAQLVVCRGLDLLSYESLCNSPLSVRRGDDDGSQESIFIVKLEASCRYEFAIDVCYKKSCSAEIDPRRISPGASARADTRTPSSAAFAAALR
jgi:hypothetical protein